MRLHGLAIALLLLLGCGCRTQAAFPSIADADTKSGTVVANSTSWTITYPTNVAAGDLLLLFIGSDGDPGFSASGFTIIAASELSASSVWLLGKVAAGSETGTFTATAGAGEQGGWRIFRIPASSWFGGSLPSGVGIDSDGVATRGSSGISNVPDPSANDPSTWGTEDTLWIAAIGVDTSRTISVFPLADRNTADVSGGSTGATLGLCTTTSAVASLDPGTFTISASDDWAALTVGIRPAAGAAPPALRKLLLQGVGF